MENDWHKSFLDTLEKYLQKQQGYKIRNSNNERLYLPYKPRIKRTEILSNPDMILVNRENGNIDFIFEVEYQINYKKIVGIAILTDIALRQMNSKCSSKLILITKEHFPNSELIQREIKAYTKNIEFHLTDSHNFDKILGKQMLKTN